MGFAWRCGSARCCRSILAVREPDDAAAALARFSGAIPYPLVRSSSPACALAIVQLGRSMRYGPRTTASCCPASSQRCSRCSCSAAANRYLLAPRFEGAADAAARPLATRSPSSSRIALAILALVALWRFTPPPRALAASETTPSICMAKSAMAQIELAPQEARGARGSMQVLDGEFRPLAAKEVMLAISNAAAGIEPVRRAGASTDDGGWRIEDFGFRSPGEWRLRVEILVSDFDKVMLEQAVMLPRAP